MKTILIADSEKAYRATCKEALEAEGFAVSLAATGKEALDKICAERPDLVILDICLPGGGVEMLGQIEQGGRGPSVIVTACFHPCDEGFLSWRAEEWVVKSKDLGELIVAVRRLLAARAARRAPASAGPMKPPVWSSRRGVPTPHGMPVASPASPRPMS